MFAWYRDIGSNIKHRIIILKVKCDLTPAEVWRGYKNLATQRPSEGMYEVCFENSEIIYELYIT